MKEKKIRLLPEIQLWMILIIRAWRLARSLSKNLSRCFRIRLRWVNPASPSVLQYDQVYLLLQSSEAVVVHEINDIKRQLQELLKKLDKMQA